MSDEATQQEETNESAPQVDPVQLQYATEQLRSEQNLAMGVVAGLVASLVGAAIWAGVTIATGYQIGWMAVGVGFLVGFAVRIGGKGLDPIFGIAGAALALLGCGVGNLLAVCGILAQEEGAQLMNVLSSLDLEFAQQLMVATFSPIDLLFYGLAVYEGYRLAFRQVSQEELDTLLPGQ